MSQQTANPFYVADEEAFRANLEREADAVAIIEAEVKRIISECVPNMGGLVDAQGKPLQDHMKLVMERLDAILVNYLAMPTLLELQATPTMEQGNYIGSFAVAYMFYNEFARMLQALFPEFTPHVTKIPLVALIELSNPSEKTLLDAFNKRFNLTIRDPKTNALIVGDERKAHQDQRVRFLVGHTVDFLAMKGMVAAVATAPDAPKQVQITPKGQRLLDHLKAMEFQVRAMQEAHTRLGLQGIKINQGV